MSLTQFDCFENQVDIGMDTGEGRNVITKCVRCRTRHVIRMDRFQNANKRMDF